MYMVIYNKISWDVKIHPYPSTLLIVQPTIVHFVVFIAKTHQGVDFVR